jgi:hypothetical protein
VYTPQWYPSPIKLAPARSGKVQVRHRVIPVGAETPVVGMRQAIVRGVTPVTALVQDVPLTIHELVEEGHGMWMTDLPEELNQIHEMLSVVKPRGRVLVGGLGLGIVAALVAALPDVQEVTVVERSPDVVKLCAGVGYWVRIADIHRHLEVTEDRFDYYLLDTWCGTNEGTWWDEVFPFRRAIRRKHGTRPKVHCWAEDIMAGQILSTLTHPPHWRTTYLPCPMTKPAARWFFRNVGLPAWEEKYGEAVDRYTQEKEVAHA